MGIMQNEIKPLVSKDGVTINYRVLGKGSALVILPDQIKPRGIT